MSASKIMSELNNDPALYDVWGSMKSNYDEEKIDFSDASVALDECGDLLLSVNKKVILSITREGIIDSHVKTTYVIHKNEYRLNVVEVNK